MDKTTIRQIKELYASVAWTHKIQEKESDILHRKQVIFNIISIVLLALTSSEILSTIFISQLSLQIVSAVVSFISLATSIFTLTTCYEALSVQHKASALEFLSLRNDLQIFLSDIKIKRYEDKTILEKRDDFYNKYNHLCKSSLSASNKAVKIAEQALKCGKDNGYSDDELDAILPEHLRGING